MKPEFTALDKLIGEIGTDSLSDFAELMRPREDKQRGGYFRFCAKGGFELGDYGRGLLYLRVWPLQNNALLNPSWCVRLYIGNVDDGSWGAWSKQMTREVAKELVTRIHDELFDDLSSLPTSAELNKLLTPYGLYGEFEG